jgi:hypothetical protein
LDRRLGEPQSQFGRRGKGKILDPASNVTQDITKKMKETIKIKENGSVFTIHISC